VTSSVRAPYQPQVPTAREAGYPGLGMDGLVGLFGPPRMPLALRERITSDIRAVTDPAMAERLAITGQIMSIGGPQEFAASIDEQRARIAEFAKELGVKPLSPN
jgi:tripartite-type tricarboxylate transporter receptor subunit TctC